MRMMTWLVSFSVYEVVPVDDAVPSLHYLPSLVHHDVMVQMMTLVADDDDDDGDYGIGDYDVAVVNGCYDVGDDDYHHCCCCCC